MFDDRTNTSSPDSTCAQVRELLSSVVDGRATTAEEQFVRTHLPECPGCASEMAFQRTMKAAWAKTPVEMPPSSLSARIAAATYKKPTFAERFAAAFAFLQPVPVRVAIGVAAVAGIGYFTVPRVPEAPINPQIIRHQPERPVVASDNTHTKPATVKQAPPVEKPTAEVVQTTPKKESVVKKAPLEKPSAVVNEAPVIAHAPVERTETKPIEKPTAIRPAIKPAVKPTATQVAVIKPRRSEAMTQPTESTVTPKEPKVTDATPPVEVATVTPPTAPVADPQTKEPPAVKEAKSGVFAVAGEDNPGFKNGSSKINSSVAGRPLSGRMSGSVQLASNGINTPGIVTAPMQ